jgi:hypothetical protein
MLEGISWRSNGNGDGYSRWWRRSLKQRSSRRVNMNRDGRGRRGSVNRAGRGRMRSGYWNGSRGNVNERGRSRGGQHRHLSRWLSRPRIFGTLGLYKW